MRPLSVVALAGCAIGGTKTTTVTVTPTVKPHPAQAETGNVKYFGTPVSVTKLDATWPGVDDAHPVLRATTRGTVIDSHMKTINVTAHQLAPIAAGAKTPKLMEGLDSGLWVTSTWTP